MGYYDDFYQPGNILGYTGILTENPSVYFLQDLGHTQVFGRITQAHEDSDNVGRSLVRRAANYKWTYKNSHGVHYESAFVTDVWSDRDGWVAVNAFWDHESRSPFHRAEYKELFTLMVAILTYPDLKKKDK